MDEDLETLVLVLATTQIVQSDGETMERLNLLTEQDEKDLIDAANVVATVHNLIFGYSNAFFSTAQHGWNNAWYVDAYEVPGKVVIHSLN